MNDKQFFFIFGFILICLSLFVLYLDVLFPLPEIEDTLAHIQRLEIQGSSRLGTYPNASVTLIEYSDFECPYCKLAVPILHALEKEYGDRLNIIYKHTPLEELHPHATNAAKASECAREQGKFWEYHDLLFQNQHALDETSLKVYAKELDLDQQRFNTCFDTHEKAYLVQQDLHEAISKGVQGTPTFFVNDVKVVGLNEEELRYAIKLALEEQDAS